MFEELDSSDFAQAIRQERDGFSGVFLILEGKNDDKALKRHIDQKSCSLHVVNGKPVALEVLTELEDEGFTGVVCILDVDYDYDHSAARLPSLDSLLLTGVHDLDVAIILTSAFDIWKDERCLPDRVRSLERAHGMDLRGLLFEVCRPLGCLRFLSARNSRTMNPGLRNSSSKILSTNRV